MAESRGKTKCYHIRVQATLLSRTRDALKARHTIVKLFMLRKLPNSLPKVVDVFILVPRNQKHECNI